jgi:hypothetical protein
MRNVCKLAGVIALLLAGSASADNTLGMRGGKTASAKTAAPKTAQAPTPAKLRATVVIRGGAKDVTMTGDTTEGARALCAYSAGKPMPDTLAVALGARDRFELQAQLTGAKKSPKLDGFSIAIQDEAKTSLLTWAAGPGACDVKGTRFDGKAGQVKLSCRGFGAQLGAPRTLEATIVVEGCPAASPKK